MANTINSYENYDHEPQEPKKRKPVKEKKSKKRGWGGRILCLLLGFIMGATALPGTVALIGVLVAVQPVDKTVETVDAFTNMGLYNTLFGSVDEDGNVKPGILNNKYSEMKIGDIVKDVTEAVQGLSGENANIASLNEISPMVGVGIDNLLQSLENLSVPIDRDELMEMPFQGEGEGVDTLGEYIGDCFLNASAGDLLKGMMGADMNGLLMTLCYGEEGVDYQIDAEGAVVMIGDATKTTINDLFGSDMSNVLDKLPVSAFITPDASDSVMCAIAYGPASRYTMNGDEVVMKQVEYTYKDGKFYDDNDEEILCNITALNDSVYLLEIDSGETDEEGKVIFTQRYVHVDGENKGLVYKDQACTEKMNYKKPTIADLSEDSMSLIDSLALKDVLDVTPSSPAILLSLAYGQRGVDYELQGEGASATIHMLNGATPRTVGDLRGSNSLIDDIPLSDVIAASDDTLVMYLLYGREDVHYRKYGDTIEMQQRYIGIYNGVAYNEYGEQLDGTLTGTTTYVEDGVTYILEAGVGEIKTKDGNTALPYIVYDENNNAVYFRATTIGDLSSEDNIISNLTNRISIGEIMSKEDLESNKFLSSLSEVAIADLPTEINKLTIQEIYEDDIYDEHGNLKGEWKYLLINEEGVEQDYTVQEMDKLIENMSRNMASHSLQELHDDGIVSGMDNETLAEELLTEFHIQNTTYTIALPASAQEKTVLGELTIEETMIYMDSLYDAIKEAEDTHL